MSSRQKILTQYLDSYQHSRQTEPCDEVEQKSIPRLLYMWLFFFLPLKMAMLKNDALAQGHHDWRGGGLVKKYRDPRYVGCPGWACFTIGATGTGWDVGVFVGMPTHVLTGKGGGHPIIHLLPRSP